MSKRGKVKLALVGLAVVLLVIIIFQNSAQVETHILFATITMPRSVLLLIVLAGGFLIGLATAGRLLGRR